MERWNKGKVLSKRFRSYGVIRMRKYLIYHKISDYMILIMMESNIKFIDILFLIILKGMLFKFYIRRIGKLFKYNPKNIGIKVKKNL